MVNQYYYLKASLPVMKPWQPVSYSLQEIHLLISEGLSASDLDAYKYLLLAHDHQNIANAILQTTLENTPKLSHLPSLYSSTDLANLEANPHHFSGYLHDFLVAHRDNLHTISQNQIVEELMSGMLAEILAYNDPFLTKYYAFEIRLASIWQHLNSNFVPKTYQSTLVDNETIRDIGLHANDQSFLASAMPFYGRLNELVLAGDLLGAERFVDEIRWQFIDELIGTDWSSRNDIFGYFLQYKLLARWTEMNETSGKLQMQKIRKEITHAYSSLYTNAS